MVKFLIQETHNSLHALPVIDKKNICKKKKCLEALASNLPEFSVEIGFTINVKSTTPTSNILRN